MSKPVYVVDVIKDLVDAVSVKLTPGFQTIEGAITGVHYLHGHPVEIIETLGQRDKSDQGQFNKYPLIALFQDFPERHGNLLGTEAEVVLHIIIAKSTMAAYKADERYTRNFKPFLYPIYKEFLRQIYLSPRFRNYDETLIDHTKIDRLYWGREGLYKNEGNVFNDRLDCIEIRDLRLNINLNNC